VVSSRLCSSPGAHGFDAVAEDLLGATLGVEALKRAGATYTLPHLFAVVLTRSLSL